MAVFGAQLLGEQAGAAEADRCAFDIHQQRRALAGRQGRPVAQAAVGEDQQALALGRFQPLAAGLPQRGLLQGVDQRGAAASAELVEPVTQRDGGLLSLPQPARLRAGGVQQGEARALAIGLVEHFGEQALGPAQRAMAAGRGRGVDYHQPQFLRPCAARAQQQVGAAARAAFEQAGRPVDGAQPAAAAGATAPAAQLARSRSGIRALGLARADAQGFFGQRGGSRRSPMAWACAGSSPHWPSPCG